LERITTVIVFDHVQGNIFFFSLWILEMSKELFKQYIKANPRSTQFLRLKYCVTWTKQSK